MAIRHGHVRAMRGNDCLPARPTLPDRKAMPGGTAAYMERGTPTGFYEGYSRELHEAFAYDRVEDN